MVCCNAGLWIVDCVSPTASAGIDHDKDVALMHLASSPPLSTDFVEIAHRWIIIP